MTNSQNIKTGTTCIGLLFKGGVMLAADRRVTSYKINADNFTKVFDLSSNVVTTVAGNAADAQLFVRHIKGEIKLLELKNERKIYASEVAMLLNSYQYSMVRSQGAIVSLILGGYDPKEQASLFDLGADGTIVSHEGYVTAGSGSIFLDGILSDEFEKNMSEKDALALVEKCFKASFKHDNASGGGFVVRVITADGIKEIERKVVKSELVKENIK